jgi:hypothetical protein
MEDRLQRFSEPFMKRLAVSAVALFCFACSDGNSAPFSTSAPAEHESVAVPSAAQQWTVDASKEKLAIMGWGVLDQLSQEDGLGVQTNTPLWMATAVQKFFDSGLNWIGLGVSLGALRMDADYFTPYLKIGLPQPRGSTTEGASWGGHNANPVFGGSFNYLVPWLKWQLAFIDALKAEATRRGVTLKVWVKVHDFPNPALSWYYDASASAVHSHYGDGIVALFQWLAANKGWVPDAIDVMNEPGTGGNAWSSTELLGAINNVVPRLSALGYTPLIIGPSYAGTTNLSQGWSMLGAVVLRPTGGSRWWPSPTITSTRGHSGNEGFFPL